MSENDKIYLKDNLDNLGYPLKKSFIFESINEPFQIELDISANSLKLNGRQYTKKILPELNQDVYFFFILQ